MLIQMIKTATGSPNGISVVTYQQSKIYDIPDTLASVFIDKMKVAVPVHKVVELKSPESQIVIKVPETQAFVKAPEVKNKFKRRAR